MQASSDAPLATHSHPRPPKRCCFQPQTGRGALSSFICISGDAESRPGPARTLTFACEQRCGQAGGRQAARNWLQADIVHLRPADHTVATKKRRETELWPLSVKTTCGSHAMPLGGSWAVLGMTPPSPFELNVCQMNDQHAAAADHPTSAFSFPTNIEKVTCLTSTGWQSHSRHASYRA